MSTIPEWELGEMHAELFEEMDLFAGLAKPDLTDFTTRLSLDQLADQIDIMGGLSYDDDTLDIVLPDLPYFFFYGEDIFPYLVYLELFSEKASFYFFSASSWLFLLLATLMGNFVIISLLISHLMPIAFLSDSLIFYFFIFVFSICYFYFFVFKIVFKHHIIWDYKYIVNLKLYFVHRFNIKRNILL